MSTTEEQATLDTSDSVPVDTVEKTAEVDSTNTEIDVVDEYVLVDADTPCDDANVETELVADKEEPAATEGDQAEEVINTDQEAPAIPTEEENTVQQQLTTEEKPVEEEPAVQEKSAEEEPAKTEEKPAEEEPAKTEEKPAEEEPVKVEEKPAEEEPAKVEEKPAEEPAKVEEKPKWTSEFSIASKPISPVASPTTTTANKTWKSEFSTHTAPSPAAAPVGTTSTESVVRVSSIRERSATFATNTNSTTSNSDFALPESRSRSGTIRDLATKFNNNPAITGGFNPSTPRSSVSMSSQHVPAHARNSSYVKHSGVQQGSLASFVGQALGVQHKGEHTGLVKNRYDSQEERARLEHQNRGANKEMAKVLERAVSEAKTAKENGGTPQAGSIAYLARKLEAIEGNK